MSQQPRISLVPGEIVESLNNAEIEAYFRQSYVLGTPPPTSVSLHVHRPETMLAWNRNWYATFHGPLVEARLKELVRVGMARAANCDY